MALEGFDAVFGTPTEADVLLLEKQIKHRLPEEYRSFLLSKGGGLPSPNRFTIAGSKGKPLVLVFEWVLGVDPTLENTTSINAYLEPPCHLPAGFVPIARDRYGNLFCLSLRPDSNSQIFFWIHDEPPGRDGMANVVPVSSSFRALLDGLHERRSKANQDSP